MDLMDPYHLLDQLDLVVPPVPLDLGFLLGRLDLDNPDHLEDLRLHVHLEGLVDRLDLQDLFVRLDLDNLGHPYLPFHLADHVDLLVLLLPSGPLDLEDLGNQYLL